MAVANGSAIHANGIATRPLILSLGHIRVSSTFFAVYMRPNTFYLQGFDPSFYSV